MCISGLNISVEGERVADVQLKPAEAEEVNNWLEMRLNEKTLTVCMGEIILESKDTPQHFTSISLPPSRSNIQNPTMCRSSIETGLSSCLSKPDLHMFANLLLTPYIYICDTQSPSTTTEEQQQQPQPACFIDFVAHKVASTAQVLIINSESVHDDGDGDDEMGFFGFHFVARVEVVWAIPIPPDVGLVLKRKLKKPAVIDKLTKQALFQVSSSSDSELVEGDCRICLQKYLSSHAAGNMNDYLIRLPNCTHVFHQKCILAWLKKSDFCPLCRDLCLKNLYDDDLSGN
ncbi:uncharacterized protein LOC112493545 [Ziziphus jujuba]|uniref:RING-type E3 ubiquitin transferase n=1 Tax=Ziziphus jujuba TaxID=326968 RepID=A0A6P6GPG9_ZIZJJ|nr:uncharacterized protein LOC112493545 [Ziziphus jujuba]